MSQNSYKSFLNALKNELKKIRPSLTINDMALEMNIPSLRNYFADRNITDKVIKKAEEVYNVSFKEYETSGTLSTLQTEVKPTFTNEKEELAFLRYENKKLKDQIEKLESEKTQLKDIAEKVNKLIDRIE